MGAFGELLINTLGGDLDEYRRTDTPTTRNKETKMIYIASAYEYEIIEVDENDVSISGDVLMSTTNKPLMSDRYHVDNLHVFGFIKWFTHKDLAIEFLGAEAERGLEEAQKRLRDAETQVERMETAIRKVHSNKLATEIQGNIVKAVSE